jgi:hypothetical protein
MAFVALDVVEVCELLDLRGVMDYLRRIGASLVIHILERRVYAHWWFELVSSIFVSQAEHSQSSLIAYIPPRWLRYGISCPS